MHLSVVIPAYNEEKRIRGTLSRIYDFLSKKNYSYEVIVVDDGSVDGTVGVVAGTVLHRENKLKIVRNGRNRGKGFSVKSGINAACGDFVLFSDADMSTPIEEVDKLFKYMDSGYDIAAGSRTAEGAYVRMHQPWYRETMGKTFNLIVKSILLGDFKDTQCGFKLFRGDIARNLAREIKIDGFCFDVEMLYLAKLKGYRVKEVGVVWDNSPQSRVKIFNSSMDMFLDLFRIRVYHR